MEEFSSINDLCLFISRFNLYILRFKPKIGDGSKLEPVYLFMTSLKLLKNADTALQSHESIFHLDGT